VINAVCGLTALAFHSRDGSVLRDVAVNDGDCDRTRRRSLTRQLRRPDVSSMRGKQALEAESPEHGR
jgi:hypothetical protein